MVQPEHGACPAIPAVPIPVPEADRDSRLRSLALNNYAFIWRSLRRLGVPAASVDDIAQQVFMIASEKIDRIELGAERSFLFQTALRAAMSVRRDRARRREVNDDFLESCLDEGLQPEEAAQQRRYLAYLDEILNSLPDDTRAVFVLFEIEELPTQEISELLDIPIGTVASRLRRSREQFREASARLRARLQRGAKP